MDFLSYYYSRQNLNFYLFIYNYNNYNNLFSRNSIIIFVIKNRLKNYK